MALIRNSKIFPNSTRTTQAKEQAARATSILERMRRALQYPHSQTTNQIQSDARQLASAIRGTGGLLPVESQLIRMAESVERLARDQANSLVTQVLNSMGTPGQLLQSWLRGREGQQSLNPIRNNVQQALNMLSQFAPQLMDEPATPEQAGGRRVEDWFEGAAVPDLPPIQPRQSPPAPAPRTPNAPSPPSPGRGGSPSGGRGNSGGGGSNRLPPATDYALGPHPNVRITGDGRWEIRGPGYHRFLQPDDPVLTGVMIPVPSSNVHSIGFRFNLASPLKSKLIIRYKQKDRRGGRSGTVGGPTYEYDDVHPDWFDDLQQVGSKGKWVWDHLRIRGTVAGHQYKYNLTRAAQGYLPRRAVVNMGIQRFVRRTRTAVYSDGRTEILRSPLPNQVVGRYSPTAHRPNVGNMDRGRLERGTPQRVR
jgi:hypothetical protein